MRVILVIDCGTTNLRVTALDSTRRVLGTVKAEGGVRHTAIDGHNGHLKETLARSIASVLEACGAGMADVERCVAYGMISSNMGLLEIAHVAAPVSAGDLKKAVKEACFPEIAPFPIAFIPGVRNFEGRVTMENFSMMDMMRGEETEAMGLYDLLRPQGETVLILPGSHNKFVRMDAEGRIRGCMTSISGELLDAMTHHTILADAVQSGFASAETYDGDMAREGAWECAHSGLGRAAFAGRILNTLGKEHASAIQSYLLGAALALDVQALGAFLPSRAEEWSTAVPDGLGSALGAAPDEGVQIEPHIFVAGKAPVQQAMCDVLDALGYEGAQAVPQEISGKMGLHGALLIGL